ncbi:FAD:protein FMN transferase [Blastomonas aquatica]|uniref:FAD:protein FMN transferase n=2 Tax=Blastomonas aquatica TaxID=1510276 RepID=A0ABQ1JL38_9SPHN|nr:FAD:protein FMN transferase [Blastomonas aquatica]
MRIAVPGAIDAAVFRSFDSRARVVRIAGATMGTTWQVRAALPAALGLSSADVQAMVQFRLDGIVADMSHWEPDSQLCRFNRAEAGSDWALSDDFAEVMAEAMAIAEASGGAFDPALGRLTDIWGLGPRPTKCDPDPDEIAQSVRLGGWQQLAFDPVAKTLHQPGGVWLDLSGIAKGFAVDAIADLLAAHGICHALVEIGGECTGRGLRPDGDPWWVDIENPPCTILPPLRVALHQLAVATSGDYVRGSHTLDPLTGKPALHQTTAVTVLAPQCIQADAWATALSVLDTPHATLIAEANALITRIVRRDGSEWISPALEALLEP